MTWFKVDDGFWSHPKIIGLSDAAVALWVRAGAYACQHLTDGEIPAPVLRMVGEKEAAAELVAAGLWNEIPGGYAFRDWSEYQETSGSVKERRAAARERQRRSRAAREAKRAAARRDISEPSADVTPSVTPSVTRDNTREFSTPDPTVGRVGTTSLPSLQRVANATPNTPVSNATHDRARERDAGETGGTLVPLKSPRGGRAVADRLNGTAHSAEAHAIARAYERDCDTPIPGKVLADIAQRVDECLASGVSADQIGRGLAAWRDSEVAATSQIPGFVHKAATARRPGSGRGKPTTRALDAQQLAEQMIAGGITHG